MRMQIVSKFDELRKQPLNFIVDLAGHVGHRGHGNIVLHIPEAPLISKRVGHVGYDLD